MRNRLKIVALLLSICGVAALGSAAVAADQAGPQVSKAVAKPLKAAQDAMAAKKPDEALAKVREAQGAAGDKTAYDNFVINIMLFQIYQQKQNTAEAITALQAAAQSQYASADQQKLWLKNIALYYFQQKDYAKAMDVADQAVKHGANDSDTLLLIAKSQYLSGKYKEAAATMNDVVSKSEKPDEESLKLLWQFDLKAGDEAGASKAVERLVANYPKPEYWQNALASLVRMDIKDAHLQLNVYRLMNDVGVLKLPSDYAEMAEIALDAGYPGETVAVLQQAFTKNVFTEQRDKDRYQHLLDGAKQRAATDQGNLANNERSAESAPSGDALVQIGGAYLSYGQPDKAVASISKGIAKGSLKSPDEANILLGIAQLRLHNASEAQKAFDKVSSSSNSGYARLGKLWALRTHSA
ncbi:MAG TPA: tetratricopeptide repeat protein [Steroidobacteraceae bacterium]|jgi:Tfp pilus assembly protein PilF